METVVTPNQASTVVTGGKDAYGYHGRGLEGKDVAAINEMFTLQTLRGVTTDIHQNARDIEVNVEKSGRATELAVEKTSAAAQLALAYGFKEVALAAATNTAALQAAIAACCCETRELVRAEAGATRDLINANSMAALRDQVAATSNENTLLKFKIAGINVPI
jgi:hypothetical protein